METLSATGLSIKDLDNVSIIANNDLLILEDVSEGDNGLTGNVTVSQLATKIASSIFDATLNFQNINNVFSGSFYGTQTSIPANFYNIISRNNLTVNNNTSITGTLSVTNTSTFANNITISSGNLLVSSGNLTISGGNTTLQALACSSIVNSGTLSATTITGTILTATTRFVGEITGAVKGDVYSNTGVKVLENGSGDANQALFYGSSSYANTSSYVTENGVPVGGTIGQVLAKSSAVDYDYIWGDFAGTSESDVRTIVTSSLDGQSNFIAKFDGAHHITKSAAIYENEGTNTLNIQSGFNVTISSGNLILSNGNLTLSSGAITSSNGFYGKNITFEETSSQVLSSQITVRGELYANTTLELSASSNVTMSLNSGQSANVVVINSSNYIISEWSASFDGGVSVADKIYWEGGTIPTILTGSTDMYIFRNINGKVLGTSAQSFN
jgi:hypothetical protein